MKSLLRKRYFSPFVLLSAMLLGAFLSVRTVYAEGNLFVDGGTYPTGPQTTATFSGIVSLGATPSCTDIYDLFKVFDANVPQNGSNVVECVESGERILGENGIIGWNETITKPLIIIGDAVLKGGGSSNITFDTPQATPVPPFVYIGDRARIDIDAMRFAISNTTIAGTGYFMTLRTAADSTIKNITFESGGGNSALLSGAANPQCDAAINSTQESDLSTSIITVHKDQTGSVTVDNSSFEGSGVALAAIYTAQPITLTDVSIVGAPLGVVRDVRVGTNAIVTKTGGAISASTIADEASVAVTPASGVTGSLVANEVGLYCTLTPPVQSAFSAVATIAGTDAYEKGDGTVTDATLTLTLTDSATGAVITNTTSAPIDFTVSFVDGTATGGSDGATGADYNSTAVSSAAIPVGESAVTIAIPTFADNRLEGNETYTVHIAENHDDVTLATNDHVVIIHDETTAQAALTASDGVEGGTDVTLSITLDKVNATGAPITFDLTAAGTARATEDYTDVFGTQVIAIADGVSTGALTVPLVNDERIENTETIIATLEQSSSNRVMIDTATQTITATIADDDTAEANIAVVTNGAEGVPPESSVFAVTLTRENATGAPITFDVSFDGSTATATEDYDGALAGTATISVPDGARSVNVTVPTYDDTLYEGDEAVRLTISNPSLAQVSLNTVSATATIADDDFPSLTANVSVVQNGAEAIPTDAIFAVTLSGANVTGAPITFDAAFVSGTATAGDDYGANVAGAGVISIPVGETVGKLVVPIVNDSALEGDETLTLRVSAPSHESITLQSASATATIADDEVAVVAAQNADRDKDREDKKKKKKKKASQKVVTAIAEPLATVSRAVEPLVEERTDVIPVAQTKESIRPVPNENTLRWTRQEKRVDPPKVLGAQTERKEVRDKKSLWTWLVLLLALLVVVVALIAHYARKSIQRRRAENVTRNQNPWWEDNTGK